MAKDCPVNVPTLSFGCKIKIIFSVICPLSVELKFNLDQYVNKRYPGLVKIVRNSKREGLIRARIHGWNAATAPVVGFFDAHVEFNTGW